MDEKFMSLAIEEGKKAFDKGEIPIGAVVVKEGQLIGRGHNLKEKLKNPICHAEIMAINQACNFLGAWRLTDCILYVTIEPCPMCAGAILQSRIKKVVIGARDSKSGACGSVVNLLSHNKFNHETEIVVGVMEEECSQLMKDFFRNLREKAK